MEDILNHFAEKNILVISIIHQEKIWLPVGCFLYSLVCDPKWMIRKL
ncbi:hypothetical protein HMPREF1565_3790 [Providencia alcalifaciens RIMD 1656011]|uniref:Uncharacterized protein n=1 Tax=Providencia alcalifaciens 205/92 TaxID=1256988 RepID=A0AAV3M2X5_9GAMM|nr:hypothetical protein HMPREF1562_4001 [Providencia alcalifaciens F90-2004]EUC96686.1 hypothetical protein HMPREF1567_0328 [Providencia alcalifaciens PAL-2]EUD03521.1 hypothetical protein HMPREF1565_3790 [Providencia alcalifaciens RIMD 1656011]EUD06845.1 hypothetical protein HMPREF1564_3089 [Providencia alcalifaciens R90-1475]EUD10173.1 hypothetical protein HMPREF1563_3139 [Providencia alcalifaciens 205/92]